eukprot:660345-Hanusia_phi.AAC.3
MEEERTETAIEEFLVSSQLPSALKEAEDEERIQVHGKVLSDKVVEGSRRGEWRRRRSSRECARVEGE